MLVFIYSYKTKLLFLGGMGICFFIKYRIYVYFWIFGDNVYLGIGWIICLIYVFFNGF